MIRRAPSPGASRAERSGRRVAIALPVLLGALYLGVSLAPFRVFASGFSTRLIGDHPDTLLQHLHCAWQWLAFAEGRSAEILRLPTMHPYRSGLAFGEPLLGVALPFALVHAWSGSTPAAFNAAVVASFLLLELAIFLWVRDLFESSAAGLLAAMLVVFNPWRVHFLTALNLLTIHYAVFGLWLLGRWLRRASLPSLLGATLCFFAQLVTAAQGALVALALAASWVAAVWLRSRLSLDARRLAQGAVAGAVLFALSAPWVGFFEEAFEVARGLPRTDQMARFSLPFAQMAGLFDVVGPSGILAALGAPALWLAIRRRRMRPGLGADLLGLCLGAGVLFVLARGPYVGPPTDPTALPHYYVASALPWLELFRAPIRLAAFTPVILALLAGGGLAALERLAPARLGPRWVRLLLPLGVALLWPPLAPAMGAPIALRPDDRELAEVLAELPASSVILSLPLDLEPTGAATDERVLIHRRPQIGGFASIMPPVFPQAANLLGQWPHDGAGVAQRLGATHLVVPDTWLRRDASAASRERFRPVASAAGRTIVSLPPLPPQRPEPELRLRAPASAAAGRWLTLSLAPSEPSLGTRGHQELDARWRSGERESRVRALALFPGLASSRDPILIHVPTPAEPGRYRLSIRGSEPPIEASVDVRALPTTADAPIRAASVALAPGSAAPDRVRAGSSFRLGVRIEAAPGPILLASSRERLPDRRGETLVVYRYRPLGPGRAGGAVAQPGLSEDLAPGESLEQTWYLSAPPHPGRYELLVRLAARGDAAMPMPWVALLPALQVVAD